MRAFSGSAWDVPWRNCRLRSRQQMQSQVRENSRSGTHRALDSRRSARYRRPMEIRLPSRRHDAERAWLGPPLSLITFEISPLSSSATVIMWWKRTVGLCRHFDGAGEHDVWMAEDAVDAEPPGFVIRDVVRDFVRRPAIGSGSARETCLVGRIVGNLGLIEVGAAVIAVPQTPGTAGDARRRDRRP